MGLFTGDDQEHFGCSPVEHSHSRSLIQRDGAEGVTNESATVAAYGEHLQPHPSE